MKTLICAKDIELLAMEHKKDICVEDDALITPSAKDAAKSNGIQIILSSQKDTCEKAEDKKQAKKTDTNQEGTIDTEELLKMILDSLK